MSKNPSKSRPPPLLLDNVDYFDFFKRKYDGWVLDDFCKQWDEFDCKKINGIVHYNVLQVFKFMLEKRNNKIVATEKSRKAKDEKIDSLEREKSGAIKNLNKQNEENTKLKLRIQELEGLWARECRKSDNDEEIVKLKNEIKNLQKVIKSKEDKYQEIVEKKEGELENVIAEVQSLQERNEELEIDLIAANNSIQNYSQKCNAFQQEINRLKSEINALNQNAKKLEIQMQQSNNVQNQLQSDLCEAKDSIQQLQSESQKEINRIKSESNEAKKELEITQNQQINKLKNELEQLKTNFEWAEEELKEYKEECKSYKSTDESQILQIQQLQLALECSTDDGKKMQAELTAFRKGNYENIERKAALLNKLAKSAKDVQKEELCQLKSVNAEAKKEKSLQKENESLSKEIQKYQLDYKNIVNEKNELTIKMDELKAQLIDSKKRRNRLDKRAERQKELRDGQQQNGNGEESSKRARFEMQPPPFLNMPVLIRQPNVQGSSPPNLISPSAANTSLHSAQLLRTGSHRNVNEVQQSPPNLVNQLNEASQMPQQFHLNCPSSNSTMTSTNFPSCSSNTNNNIHQQQQPYHPNFLPQMMPPSQTMWAQYQQQLLCHEIYMRNCQQQQQQQQHIRPPFQAQMLRQPPPPQQQQQQPVPHQPPPPYQFPNNRVPK
uniref:Uncharacterized protein n=1 Tax=Panagrolaimus superbus TaxID=310955 RepID=A0A914YTB4_9BILA